jgi:divalent metal cation (Fe/Co/Zn/Cd) transporter
MNATMTNRLKYYNNLKKSTKIAYLNLIAFVILFMIELLIALLTDSKALLAASFNNLSSIIISLGIIIGLKVSLKDPSHSHRKGYQQFETLGNLFSSFMMFLMSGIVAVLAGFMMLGVYVVNKKYHKRIESNAIYTLLKDSLSDMIMNFGTAIGILLAVKVNLIFDSLTALILGFVLCYMSYQVVKNNIFHLSGGFNPNMIQNYFNVIEQVKGVERIVDITGAMYGDATTVDVTIEVDQNKTIYEGSMIAEEIEQEIASRFDVFDVDVQVKPKSCLAN